MLQRLIYSSDPPKDAPNHIAAAQLAQTVSLVRMLGGKLWEARLRMNDAVLSKELRTEFFPLQDGSADVWRTLNREIGGAKWLDRMRNAHAFHYPTFAQIGNALEKHWPNDGSTIFGNTQRSAFFHSADVALLLAFFASATDDDSTRDPRAMLNSFAPILRELYALSMVLISLLGDVLGAFVHQRLYDGGLPIPLGNISGPSEDDLFIPYFLKR